MILVTGGRGYIGENFIKKHPRGTISYDLKDNQDVLDIELLEKYMKQVETVVHLAALPSVGKCEENPIEAVEKNIIGTLNVCKLASKHKVKIIYASSFAVKHGENIQKMYGLSKYIGEKMVAYYGGVSLRFSNVWGGENYLRLKDSAIARLNKGTWEERGHGGETRDFVHVSVVIEQIYKAINYPAGVYDVCSGDPITIAELKNRFIKGMYHMGPTVF